MSGFVAGRVYPLADPTRHDDGFGTGYAFARANDGADGCLLADCWIVNARGEVHPGLACSPVPTRIQDVVDDPMRTLRALSGS